MDNFIWAKAAVTNEEDKEYQEVLSELGMENDNFTIEPVRINLDSIEVIQPLTTREGFINLYMKSGDRWSIEDTEEIREKLKLN